MGLGYVNTVPGRAGPDWESSACSVCWGGCGDRVWGLFKPCGVLEFGGAGKRGIERVDARDFAGSEHGPECVLWRAESRHYVV